jgi:hypothetical protein
VKSTKRFFAAALIAALWGGVIFSAAAAEPIRTIPRPLPSHPGNIFLVGETVTVPAPPGETNTWHAVDYEGRTVASGKVENGMAALGHLAAGYYEVTGDTQTNARGVSVGVLEPLRAPTPPDSPIGIDVAMAWCFRPDQWAAAASFCQLAGMNRVRDRASWPELEPKRGEMAANNRYDDALKLQDEMGLQVLTVSHIAPAWANTNATRMPLDLRDAYNFYRELAKRWRGKVETIEPWNEADIIEFGGHTGDEMASFQKAAYLGLKAGNPEMPVCENVFAIRRGTTLHNFNDNEAWPYFDTFNLHHYEPFTNYPKMYADFRAVSAGRPMWVTECSWTVHWSGDDQLKELDADNTRTQSERVPKTYALALNEGAKAIFFFMLPHYSERNIQYGLLHADLTPRPSYVALAAVGRFLADAQPLGRVQVPDNVVQGYLFRAQPDGHEADVLVIWYTSEGEKDYELPQQPEAIFDLLGRPVPVTGKSLKLTRAPQYVLLAKDSRPVLLPPVKSPPFLPGKPGVVVLQALLPVSDIDLQKSGYKLAVGQTNAVPVFLYNFGTTKVQGKLRVTAPPEWSVNFPAEVELEPGERKELTLALANAKSWDKAATVGIKGDFGTVGEPVLSMRFFAPQESK